MSNIWQWIYDRRHDAFVQNDKTRLQMVDLFWQMLNALEDNPELALQYGAQSRRIAELLGDKWFAQLINHWELQTRYSYIGDYNGTLDLATKSAVEVRLPEYQAFPQRVCIHEDLISAYAQQDPIGNRDLVQQSLDYMEKEVDPSVECYRCLSILKLDFMRTTGTPDDTLKAARTTLGVVGDSPFHLAEIFLIMVEVAYEIGDWDNLLKWAIEAESNARNAERDNRLAAILLWLATHAEKVGKSDHCEAFYQQAIHRANRYGAFIGQPYYMALTAYHEMGGRLQEALEIQQQYLDLLVGKAKPYRENCTRLQIIRLKKALKQNVEDDVATLRETVKALKAPDYILNQLQDILK